MSGRIPLSAAAMKLGLSYGQARNMLLRGDLEGGRDRYGRLFVASREIRRLLAERDVARRQGRLS